jgi:predicted nucleotidyltransferase
MPLNRTPFKTDFESLAKEIVLHELKDFDCKFFLFGSRAAKTNHRFADMDIGIIPGNFFDEKQISILTEKLNESAVPFKVEVFNFKNVSEKFKEEALKQVMYWRH